MRSSNIERLVKYKKVDSNLRATFCEVNSYDDVDIPEELRFPFENFLDFRDFASHILYDTPIGIEEALSEIKDSYSEILQKNEIYECGEVLIGSYYSLYRLEKISEGYYVFRDEILKSSINLVDILGELTGIEPGDRIFGRLLILKDIAVTSSILFPVKDTQAEEVQNIIYAVIRDSIGSIYSVESAKSVLKTYGAEFILDIFTLFLGDVYDYIKEESVKTAADIQEKFFRGDFDFEKFLNKTPGLTASLLQNILEMIYFAYMEEKKLTFNDDIDYEDLFYYLLKNSYFFSMEDAKKIRDVLTNLYYFMGPSKYEENLKSLNRLQGKVFEFNSVINDSDHKYFDREVAEIVKGEGENADILIDYQIFRQYSFEFPFNVKTDMENLYQETLVGLAEVLELEPVKHVATLKNHHYPKIKIFFDFAMGKEFYFLDGTSLEENEKYLVYDRMNSDEKFATLIRAFVKYMESLKGAEQKRADKLIKTLLEEGMYIAENHIDTSFEEYIAMEMEVYGFVEMEEDTLLTIYELTDMGRKILEFYFYKPKQGNIIEFPKQ